MSRKEVQQDKAATIELKEEQNSNIYAFNKYIGILNQTKFTIYGNTGNEETSLDIQISNPIFSSANRFLAIAESGGQKLYLIEDKTISWNAEVEGNILQVHVNKNGYVAVIITGTSYKTVIKMYSPSGEEMSARSASSPASAPCPTPLEPITSLDTTLLSSTSYTLKDSVLPKC